LFLAHYIERAGTGTLDMIRLCREAGLPEPEFHPEGEQFVVVIWRHWLTETVLAQLGLNERQRQIIVFAKAHGQISNADCRREWSVSRNTAGRDLDWLCRQGVLHRMGTTGKGTHYILAGKRTTNAPIAPSTTGIVP
jgi:ATP-dependent DNA helicase RecG